MPTANVVSQGLTARESIATEDASTVIQKAPNERTLAERAEISAEKVKTSTEIGDSTEKARISITRREPLEKTLNAARKDRTENLLT